MTTQNAQAVRTLATYVGDMHALEVHLEDAFSKQLSITKDYPEAHAVVELLVSTSHRHIQTLGEQVAELGNTEKIITDKIKTLIAGLFGYAAGVIDIVRPLAASKALRDSYTAIHLAIAGYVLLSSTARALEHSTIQKIADHFLGEWEKISHDVAKVLPGLAVGDMIADGVQVTNASAADSFVKEERWAGLFHHK